MNKTKRKLAFAMVAFFCGLIVVVISASTLVGTQSTAQLIGIIVGAFGAGAAFVNAVRDYSAQRGKGK